MRSRKVNTSNDTGKLQRKKNPESHTGISDGVRKKRTIGEDAMGKETFLENKAKKDRRTKCEQPPKY